MDLHRRCRTGTKLCTILHVDPAQTVYAKVDQLGRPKLVAGDRAGPARMANGTDKHTRNGVDVGTGSPTAGGRLAQRRFQRMMARAAGPMLRVGRLGMAGKLPTVSGSPRHPWLIWMVSSSSAILRGVDLGSRVPCIGSYASATSGFPNADCSHSRTRPSRTDPSKHHAVQHGSQMVCWSATETLIGSDGTDHRDGENHDDDASQGRQWRRRGRSTRRP